MSAFTINGGTAASWDSLSGGSTNATLDTYTISARSTLLIDTDSYQCANHSAAFGSLDTVAFTGAGGTLRIDASAVRVLAYTGGVGTVPAIGTSITQGGVSGPLLGVWADWQSEPLAVGAAMPASGYLKLKAVTGGAFAAGAVGGVTAVALGPDVAGWIEVRGADTATITVPRIGRFETVGGWFELGVTTGVAGQVLPCPTTGTVAGVFPAAWVETGPGTGVYRRFAGVGSKPALSTTATDERGLIVWQTTAGIRIGSDGTNSVGFLPPSGCRVRIPSVILTCCTRTAGAGSGPRVVPNATLATRMEFNTAAAGEISISGAVVQWYCNFTQAYSLNISDSAINDALFAQEIPTPLAVSNCVVAPTQAQTNPALSLASNFAGGSISDCTFARYSTVASYVCTVTSCYGLSFDNVLALTVVLRTSGGAWFVTYSGDCAWSDCDVVGGKLLLQASNRLVFSGTGFADRLDGVTNASVAQTMFELTGGLSDVMIDGVALIVDGTHPYTSLLQSGSCADITLRNVGTPATPFNLGSTDGTGIFVNFIGNNSGVRVQRCYHTTARILPLLSINSDNGLLFDNCAMPAATQAAILSLDTTIRSVRFAQSATGQVAVYGTHWSSVFTGTTTGQLLISCNEQTALSAAQCAITAGTPSFDAQGSIALRSVGDQVTWEMAFRALGHTALENVSPTLTGTNTGNVSMTFQADAGAGYGGTWLAMTGANLAAVGAVDPAVGVRLKVRATCATANDGNLLTRVAIATVTTAVAQETLYPLDTFTATFTGIPVGTDVFVLAAGTTTLLAQQDAIPGTSYGYTFESAHTVDVGFIKQGYTPFYIRGLALSGDRSIPVALTTDRNYQ